MIETLFVAMIFLLLICFSVILILWEKYLHLAEDKLQLSAGMTSLEDIIDNLADELDDSSLTILQLETELLEIDPCTLK